ncbi:ABC transporter permease [uncultured Methylobacterium sp.]|uniref:ABC transporter permease n=1 Tax=uncultured Methylobacterium sp. TaxID=157278 RepID=UPI0035C984FC
MSRAQGLLLAAGCAFLYLPVAVLALFAFNDSALMVFPLKGLTLHWFGVLGRNTLFQEGFVTSLLIAQPVGVASAGLGLVAALAATGRAFRGRRLFIAMLLVPFLVPKTVLSVAQAILMSRVGLPRGYLALAAAETLVILPFTTAMIAAVLMRIDPRLDEAARDLGASPWQSFRLVLLPQLKGVLGAAYSVGVVLSLAELTITQFLSGRVQPLSLIVASQFRRELTPDLNAVQVVVLALTLMLVVVTETWRRRNLRRAATPAGRTPEAA